MRIRRSLTVIVAAVASVAAAARAGETMLWYAKPATQWVEALPLGNGRLGAMVFGGVASEQLQLNDENVWSGGRSDYDRVGASKFLPEVRRLLFAGKPAEANALAGKEILGDRPLGSYQPLGDLRLDFAGTGDVVGYRRELDLDTAIARVTYKQGDATFTREVFSSAPDKAIVVRLTCDVPGRIAFRATLDRKEGATTTALGSDGLSMSGQADVGKPTAGTKFAAIVRAIAEGGTVSNADNALAVSGANSVTLLVTSGGDIEGREDAMSMASLPMDLAAEKPFDTLRADHVADHQRLFRRVAIDLAPAAPSTQPTDARIEAMKAGGAEDRGLVELYFQYGRYLLIGSSRPGDLAANLQGIWNDQFAAPWFAGWHTDINVQMNYWPAESANLSECHQPMFDLIDRLRVPGRKTARDVFGMNGFYVAHRTNGNFFTAPVKGLNVWPVAAGWLCEHPFEHYRFTQDKQFLADRGYPMLKDAAEFYLEWLVADPTTGKLVSGPSVSPENSYVLPDGTFHQLAMGPTMDQAIIAELFDNCLESAKVLGIDDDFVKKVRDARGKLLGMQISPTTGRLMEWATDYAEREPGHRHMSHLYGVYPAALITPRATPDLAEAARKSLASRISGGMTDKKMNLSDSSNTGWSLAHNLNLWARLGEPAQAHDALMSLVRRCTFPNLMDVCPSGPKFFFEIDGNLGAVAGVIEMLVQSHEGEIALLPALPADWVDGKITGVRARGAVEVSLEWKAGKLARATLKADRDGPIKVRLGEIVKTIDMKAGAAVTLDGALNSIER